MKKCKLILVASLCIAGMYRQTVFAAHASGHAPRVTSGQINGVAIPAAGLDVINSQLSQSFNQALDTLNLTLGKFQNQKKLAQGFADANTYAAQSATFQGFENYNLFAVSSGIMLGVQAPALDPQYYSTIGDKIKATPDLYAGVGVGLAYYNVGLNLKFLVPGLYANTKFGMFKFESGDSTSKFSAENMCFGLGVNYTILKNKTFAMVCKWRGVSVGSGLLFQKNKVSVAMKLDSIVQSVPLASNPAFAGVNPDIQLNPIMNLGVDVSTFTVPIDVSTSVCLLWFLNLNAGLGFDINFGSSDINLTGTSSADLNGLPTNLHVQKGDFTIDGSTKGVGPSFGDFRLMTGVGFNISVLKVDLPIVYYIPTGIAFGLTAGVVF